ncbi:apolipoprotein L3-like [Haliotis cracherodii]|uniref:apolipoprotein L3-like n=1 Tax=Haliotis cracherodii TaxID=6455 RepID=UPI0039E9DF6C
MSAADSKLEELSGKTAECVARHDDVVKQLLELADELDKEEREVDIAKIGFASTGAVGGGLALLGFGLSFVTFGASLILTAVGAGISAVSGVGGLATSITEKIMSSKKLKEAKAAVQAYSDSIKSFSHVLESFCEMLPGEDQDKMWKSLKENIEMEMKISSVISDSRKLVDTIVNIKKLMTAADNVKGVVEGIQGEGTAAAKAMGVGGDLAKEGDEAFKALSTGAKAVQIGGMVLAGVGVVIDIGSIIYYGIKVHNRKPSDVAEVIRKLAKSMN